MKKYPSISKKIDATVEIYAFDKLDGSNIRAEFSQKRGFYKFGTRKCMIDESHDSFGEAVNLIRSKYESDLAVVFKKQRWEHVVCFFEYYGPNSFAGFHEDYDEKTVTLFDVNVYKKGFLAPQDFLKYFGHLDIAKLLYHGNPNPSFIRSVENGELSDMTFEGVVCKAQKKKKITMFKVKNRAWLDKLKNRCGEDEKLFTQLA